MPWNNALNYLKHINGNDEHREDSGLPLGARIGSLVKLSLNPFIKATSSGSLIEMPTNPDQLIYSISHVKLNMEGNLYHYHLTKPEDSNKHFLQVFADTRGEIKEILYCTLLNSLTPETVEEQDIFTGTNGSGLGDESFTISADQLKDFGLSPDKISATIPANTDSITFRRDVGEGDFVSPFTGKEIRIDDTKGINGMESDIYFMPYVREYSGQSEYLLISTQIVRSVNGQNSKSIFVDFMIGIPLEIQRVVVQ